MSKLDILISTLHLVDIDPNLRKDIISKYEELSLEEKNEKSTERRKKGKKQYVVTLKSEKDISDIEIVAAVWQIGENDDPAMLIDKIRTAAVDSNLAARKKKFLITSFSDCISFLKPKWLKNQGVKRLSRDWERTVVVKEELVTQTPEIE